MRRGTGARQIVVLRQYVKARVRRIRLDSEGAIRVRRRLERTVSDRHQGEERCDRKSNGKQDADEPDRVV